MYRIPILFWRLPDTGPTAGAKEKLAKSQSTSHLYKGSSIADRRDRGAGNDRADARNSHQLSTVHVGACQNLYLFGDVFDAKAPDVPQSCRLRSPADIKRARLCRVAWPSAETDVDQ